jgi:uncharacterized protein YbcV (DUF1398 family)
MQGSGKINEPFKGKKKVPDSVIDEILFKKYPETCRVLFNDMFNQWIERTTPMLYGNKNLYKKYRKEYWEGALMQWAVNIVQAECNYHPYTVAHLPSRLCRTYRRLYCN